MQACLLLCCYFHISQDGPSSVWGIVLQLGFAGLFPQATRWTELLDSSVMPKPRFPPSNIKHISNKCDLSAIQVFLNKIYYMLNISIMTALWNKTLMKILCILMFLHG